jgi:hypothetical protein
MNTKIKYIVGVWIILGTALFVWYVWSRDPRYLGTAQQSSVEVSAEKQISHGLEDAEIEELVKQNGAKTAVPLRGKWAFSTILIVPPAIEDNYVKYPLETLQSLASIVEKGKAEDGLAAVGYIYALTSSPIDGALVTSCPSEDFDVVNEVTNKTWRTSLLIRCKDRIKAVEQDVQSTH